jgi:pimeloyl-ACP methyl ester carboxylesterase
MKTRRVVALAVALLALGVGATGAAARPHVAASPVAQLPEAALARLMLPARLHAAALGSSPFSAPTVTPTSCGKTTGVLCTQVVVPLDRSGGVPGTLSLHVEVVPAAGVARGVMFLVAGGPGQGSAHVFGLGSDSALALYRFLFPGYTLVAYDDRGTGTSGLLDCPTLQNANTADAEQSAAAACAAMLGPQRDFYSTAEHAEDLEAVRQALGFDKVAIYGVSYGTKLAMAYALAHPDHVDRLLLDSVLPPELPDPFSAEVLRTLPATLAAFCSDGGCRPATADFPGDVVAVANKLAARPLNGKVPGPGGTRTIRVDGLELLSIVLDADLNPGLAAELPAVVKAARLGNTQPLVRLAALHAGDAAEPPIDLSFALYAATVCRDGPFPWAPDTPVADRRALEQAALAGLPAGSLGPFGSWAARFGNADFCLNWPSPSGGAALGAGPLPNVPVLVVSGGFDMRTPTAGAQSVVSRFPQGQLLVVPGIGHSTVTADFSACAARAVHSWMTGSAVPAQCARPKALVVPVPALPAPGSARPARPATPAKTLAIVTKTVREAEAAWLMTAGATGSTAPVPGVFGGRLVATSAQAFKLVGYSIARGVAVSGTIRIAKIGPPLDFQGLVTVSGAGASSGVLGLRAGVLRGTLGGKIF